MRVRALKAESRSIRRVSAVPLRVVLPFLCVALALVLALVVDRHAAGRPPGKLVPRSGALFGAFADMGVAGWHESEVLQFERLIGRRLDIDHRYASWNDVFPGREERWDVAHDRIPMITWEPWDVSLADIGSGHYDNTIRSRADGLREFGAPVFLRFAHEMNGDWYPWAGSANNESGREDGTSKYVRAWRHIHDLFAEEQATNVVWVWCPNASSFPDNAWNDLRRYYPGERYVDWVCVDGYNAGRAADSSWRSFVEIVRPVYEAYARVKPIMIGEIGSVERGGAKGEWIEQARDELKERFPAVAAFLWFNIDKNGHDWRVDSSATALAAYRAMAADPYFNVADSLGAASVADRSSEGSGDSPSPP
jgi:hypothetical protein